MLALDLQPVLAREEPAKWLSLLLTLLVHGALLGVLFVGVQWQRKVVEPVQVDLYSALPQPVIVPPAPPPPVVETPRPEPQTERTPDIALPKPPEKPQPKPEPPRPEPPQPTPEVPRAPGLDARQLELLNLEKDAARRRAESLAAARALLQGEVQSEGVRKAQADWQALIEAKVRGNLSAVIPPDVTGKPVVEVMLELLPDRSIKEASVKIVRSSGSPVLDRAVEAAIYKSSPLPAPPNTDAFQRNLRFFFHPLGK